MANEMKTRKQKLDAWRGTERMAASWLEFIRTFQPNTAMTDREWFAAYRIHLSKTANTPKVRLSKSELEVKLREAINLAVGQASMAWQHPERAGVFQSDAAAIIADELYRDVTVILQANRADA